MMICGANILIYCLLVACLTQQQQQHSAAAADATRDPDYLSKPTTTTTATHETKDETAATKFKHDVHKLMSEQDLRRTFQVARHDQVPEYEVLKLQVHRDGSHLISPISDLGELLAAQQQQLSHAEHRNQQQQHPTRTKREATSDSSSSRTKDNNNINKLIVIDLSTFGQDFKLRLKRNVDFQQRIKDMKMFMAETTQDGQLKYTEVSHPSHQHQQHSTYSSSSSSSSPQSAKHKQEPHKRAANADDELAAVASGSGAAAADGGAAGREEEDEASTKSDHKKKHTEKGGGWNIGSTYHDEDNLAALLIDHDKKTGQLQIEGTIGNDFVIKPMPKATIEALQQQRQQQAASKQVDVAEQQLAAAVAASSPARPRLDKSADKSLSSNSTAAAATAAAPATTGVSGQRARVELDKAIHMHDDDPHDDDEMFLDEDEAIDLAQLQLQAGSSNSSSSASQSAAATTSINLPPPANNSSASQPAPLRVLSKAASERKWNKYRKLLLAQTQVPKIHTQMSHVTSALESNTQQTSSSSAQQQRARRQTPQKPDRDEVVSISHHIVFRQRPSSEESSQEHQHSFMISPVGSSMERLAYSFQPKREKRDLATGGATSPSRLMMIDQVESAATDTEEDPLGGQFYLEPASVTGFERAGHGDWSFQRRAPYSFNHTDATNTTDTTTRGRFKRQAPMMGGGRPQVRRKRQAPETVWPEVLLVVDYDSFLLHGSDSRDVKRYFVSFWNGVDLRYKLLVHPHIRISLAGMIVAKDRDATPYLERNRLRAPNADAVDAAGALTDMGKYLYREDRLPTYDLAVVITKLDMCRRRFEGGRCNRGTAGFAYVGGACVVNKRLEKVNSVAIIEDSGGFSGIIVAAHEVGHLLGCVHDGSPPPSYLGGPGATHCPWEDGFIMSDLRHTERGFRWSQCSVEQFKHFLNGETATCLYNYPHESQMLNRLLPGHMLSLDEQCKRDRGTNACFKDARVCAQLFCFDSASGYCVSYRPAAEGSPCGEGQVCRNGKCVGEIENIIPDYTTHSQTVVARSRPNEPLVGQLAASRLADNRLSASSTSAAMSSPDSKPATVAAVAPAAAVISSRMDTGGGYLDGPVAPQQQQHHYSTLGGYASQFGGRYAGTTSAAAAAAGYGGGESMTSSSAGVVVSRQRHPGVTPAAASTSTAVGQRSAKLIAAAEPGTRQSKPLKQQQQLSQQRSGSLVSKPASASRAAIQQKQTSTRQQQQQPHHQKRTDKQQQARTSSSASTTRVSRAPNHLQQSAAAA